MQINVNQCKPLSLHLAQGRALKCFKHMLQQKIGLVHCTLYCTIFMEYLNWAKKVEQTSTGTELCCRNLIHRDAMYFCIWAAREFRLQTAMCSEATTKMSR